MAAPQPLQFEALGCRPEVAFWLELARLKLHVWKGEVAPVPVQAEYSAGGHAGVPPVLSLAESALAPPQQPASMHIPVLGTLINYNTMDELKRVDRRQLLLEEGGRVWAAVQSGSWLSDPGQLTRLLLLTYADLKRHRFHHCVAVPTLLPAKPFPLAAPPRPVGDVLDAAQQTALLRGYAALRETCPSPAFLVTTEPTLEVKPLSAWSAPAPGQPPAMWVGVVDPSGHSAALGWPVRNLLFALTHHFSLEGTLRVLAFREVPGREDISRSLVVDVAVSAQALLASGATGPAYTGWPADNRLKMVDLSPLLDEEKLSRSSAHLNLSLMKWRMLPTLDLQRLEDMQCLLIGAGTLGCNVARTLMMWGVSRLTLVDYGTVGYSNPVRQTLFEFRDAVGGRGKAEAAAEACKRIYPAAEVKSITLTVPMPGHPVAEAQREEARAAVEQLETLIRNADAVFLLTDSRESRWLPTMLCARHDKLCLNAALGFSAYVVMRHGVPSQGDTRLGCYFCSEVTAPRDSLSDRTLDQQCTVTRPGISAVASALAVELMAAVVQHPHRERAAPDEEAADFQSVLGCVPHQIRGQVDTFQQYTLKGHAFDRCTACSPAVLAAYAAEGFAFVERVLSDPDCLEMLTGLTQVKAEVDTLLEDHDVDLGSDEEWAM